MKLQDLMPVALMIVVAVIAISIGTQIVSSIQEDQCATGGTYNSTTGTCVNSTGQYEGGAYTTEASNASHSGMMGLGELGGWIPTIALVTAAAVVIGVLVSSFAFGKR